jgi:hypothetical protein
VQRVGLLRDVEGVQRDGELPELVVRTGRLDRASTMSRSLTTTASLATRFMPSATALTTSTSQRR